MTMEQTLGRINERKEAIHNKASEEATLRGRPRLPAFVPLTLEQVLFPKWVYKGFGPSGKAGHAKFSESKLVKSQAELLEAEADGFYEAGKAAETKSKSKKE